MSAESPSPAMLRRVVIASMIGTSIEWYDYYIFGIAAALAIGPNFFPKSAPDTATFAAFATFAVGFVAKPIGSVVFGHFGDRVGRKSALVVSLLLMGGGTMLVGCLPGYKMIGVWAPILLVALRIVQGIGIGGEWGGAALMAAEFAPKGKRGLFVSWPQFGSPAGLLLATGAFLGVRAVVPAGAFTDWAWRIPFLASGLLIVIGLIIRLKLTETPQFQRVLASGGPAKVPIVEVVSKHLGTTLLVSGAFLFNTFAFFIVSTFLLSYATKTAHLPDSVALSAQLVGGVTLAIGVPIAAWVSDKVGRKKTILALYLVWLVWAWPMFGLIATGSPAVFIGVVAFGMMLTSAYGPIGAFLIEQFDTRIRYTGASVGQTVGSMISGGFGPLLVIKVQQMWGAHGVALLIIAAAALSSVCVLALRDRSREDIDAEAVGAQLGEQAV